MKTMVNKPNKLVMVFAALFIVAFIFSGTHYFSKKSAPEQAAMSEGIKNKGVKNKKPVKSGSEVVTGEIIEMPTIDYQELTRDKNLQDLMQSRKKNLGIDKSLDMVVKSDETVKIGPHKVSMRDILEKAFVKQGEVFEEKIEESGAVKPQEIKEYGIYVVQKGDSIWNIHFNILKDYYNTKGINLSPNADEPQNKGLSSGIGKILKFSENMVIIYNLLEKKVDTDINLLKPLRKIVVYNMNEIFSLLKDISYENVDRIQFDGKTIWIPADKS